MADFLFETTDPGSPGSGREPEKPRNILLRLVFCLIVALSVGGWFGSFVRDRLPIFGPATSAEAPVADETEASGLPAEFPVPIGATAQDVRAVDGGSPGFTAAIVAPMSCGQLSEYYETKLPAAGWRVVSSTAVGRGAGRLFLSAARMTRPTIVC